MAGWRVKPNEHERVTALLSPYLDGQTSEAERALVERHLASCAECARSLATLKATVAAVQAMPRVRAARSFALPRSMARQQPSPWLVPALRAATVVATLLFAITVAGDMFLANTLPPAAAPAPVQVAREFGAPTAPTAAQSELQSRPQVLPQALDTAAPAATRSAGAANQAVPAAPGAPLVEQLVQPGGLGAGSGLQPAAASPTTESEPQAAAASKRASATPTAMAAAQAAVSAPSSGAPVTLTHKAGLTATAPAATVVAQAEARAPLPTEPAEPMPVVGAPGPQPAAMAPPSDAEARGAPQTARLRLAEGALALLAVAFGLTAWLASRRSR